MTFEKLINKALGYMGVFPSGRGISSGLINLGQAISPQENRQTTMEVQMQQGMMRQQMIHQQMQLPQLAITFGMQREVWGDNDYISAEKFKKKIAKYRKKHPEEFVNCLNTMYDKAYKKKEE